MSRSCLNCALELFACLDPDMSFDEATLQPPLSVFHCEALSLQKVSITKPNLLGPLVLATSRDGGKKNIYVPLLLPPGDNGSLHRAAREGGCWM